MILVKIKLKMLFNSLVGRLFISHMVLIIIVCISNFLSHSLIYDVLEERLINESKVEFNNVVKECEEYISDIKNYLIYISMDTEFQRIISSKNISDYSVYKLSNYMGRKYIESPQYINTWIYHKRTEYIVTRLTSYPKRMFWEKLYSNPAYNNKFWEEQLNTNEQFIIYPPDIYYDNSLINFENANITNNFNRYMTIIYKPFINSSYYLCAFVEINRFFENNNSLFGEQINIAANKAQIENVKANQPDGIYTLESFSEKNNIYYYMELDYRNIKQNLSNINIKFTVITIIAIAMCLILSVFFSIKINTPLKNIGEIFLPGERDKSPFTSLIDLETIRKHIYSLIQLNLKYKAEIENKDRQLQSYILIEKIRNLYIPDGPDVSSYLKYSFSNGFYMICIKIHPIGLISYNPSGKSIVFLNYSKKLSEYFLQRNRNGWNCIYFSENQENFILLLDNRNKQIEKYANQIKDYLELIRNDEVCFTVLVSELQSNLNGLDMVYNNILILLNKRCMEKVTQIVYQSNISEVKNHYTFTTNEMKYFSDSISNGYIKESMEIMKRVLEYNYRKRINCFQFSSLCYEFINLCIKAVIDTLSYLPGEIDIIQIQTVLKSLVCYEDYVQICENFIEEISSYIVKTDRNNDYMIDYILRYIQEKYYEDIYLDLFAEKLCVSKVYICKRFKEKTGTSLVDYLNKYRMEIACEKLKNTDLKIKDIASEVGIENVNSFIRTFKKYYGKSLLSRGYSKC